MRAEAAAQLTLQSGSLRAVGETPLPGRKNAAMEAI